MYVIYIQQIDVVCNEEQEQFWDNPYMVHFMWNNRTPA